MTEIEQRIADVRDEAIRILVQIYHLELEPEQMDLWRAMAGSARRIER